MKTALFFISAMISTSSVAFAAEESKVVGFRCETPWPTASAIVRTQDQVVRMDLNFHYGTGRIPLRLDSVSPDDLATIQSNFDLARKLDQIQQFEWPLDQCVSQPNGLFRCYGGRQNSLQGFNGLKADSVIFFTTRSAETQVHSSRSRYAIEVWLTIGSSVLRLALPYDEKDCAILSSAAEAPKSSLRHPI